MTESYKPINGKQFMKFMEKFCYKCEYMKKGCKILALMFRLNVTSGDYPTQLIYKKGKPACTSFRERLK